MLMEKYRLENKSSSYGILRTEVAQPNTLSVVDHKGGGQAVSFIPVTD